MYCYQDELDAPTDFCMAGHFCTGGTVVPDPVGLENGL